MIKIPVNERMTNKEAIAFFKAEHPKGFEKGDEFFLCLPDGSLQTYTYVGEAWRSAKGKNGKVKKYMDYVFEFACAVCGHLSQCQARWNFVGVSRTCAEHRGQMPKGPRLASAEPRKTPKPTPVLDAVLAYADAASMALDRMPIGRFVEAVARTLPEPENVYRDTRFQRVKRALGSLAVARAGLRIRRGYVYLDGA